MRIEAFGLVLIVGSPIVAENELKVGADGLDVGTYGVDVSAGSSHASEWLQAWSISSGMVVEVGTEVALDTANWGHAQSSVLLSTRLALLIPEEPTTDRRLVGEQLSRRPRTRP